MNTTPSQHPILVDGRWQAAAAATGWFHAFEPAQRRELTEHSFPISDWSDLDQLVAAGRRAAKAMAGLSGERIGAFLDAYAATIEARADALVASAQRETGLPAEPRLRSVELPRTTGQLRQAASAARDGSWTRPTLDTAANIRSLHGPLGGPVLVLGPNNFPYAFNGIAGGDFAAAIAAGNPVIAKAHPGHPYTTVLLAQAALEAATATGMPSAAVQLFFHCEEALGLRLVAHPDIAAVAFTGSRAAGLALKAAADQAGTPIYLEMSSLNPVFVLSGALRERGKAIATELHGSCALGAGQFCTRPGLAVLAGGEHAEAFIKHLRELTLATTPGVLLGPRSPDSIARTVSTLREAGAEVLAGGEIARDSEGYAHQPTLLRCSGQRFLDASTALQNEAFGHVCLLVVADDDAQMQAIAEALEGNLTATLYSDTGGADDLACAELAAVLRAKVGRLLNDKMPTGVAVSSAMNHGGPYPATGHPGFTAVGLPASILRFSALHCYDNVRAHRLPPALRDDNPSPTLLRLVDGEWTTRNV